MGFSHGILVLLQKSLLVPNAIYYIPKGNECSEFSITDNGFNIITKAIDNPQIYWKFLFEFQQGKHFFFFEDNSQRWQIALSFSSNLFNQVANANSSYPTIQANMPNTYNNNKLFSLNTNATINANLNQVVRSTTGVVTLGGTCGSSLHVQNGPSIQCYDDCPTELPFENFKSNGQTWCDYSCLPNFFYHEGTSRCSELPCNTFNNSFFKIDSSTKICMTDCTNELPYIYGLNCVSKCNNFITQVSNEFTVDERGTCETTCAVEKFVYESILLFSDETPKTYCLETCPQLLYSAAYDTPNKKCLTECDTNSTLPYKTTDLQCVASCLTTDFKVASNDFTCVASCREIGDDYQTTGFECVSECPEIEPFVFEFQFCSSNCPNLNSGKFCVNQCEDQALKDYFEKKKTKTTIKPYIYESKECVSACSSTNIKFTNSITLECVNSCPPPCIGDNCHYSSLEFSDESLFCISNCSNSNEKFLDYENKKCVSVCPTERKFFVDEVKTCLPSCPTTALYVEKVNKCEDNSCSEFNYKCVNSCSSSSFVFTSKLVNFCVSECPQFHEPFAGKCVLTCDASKGFAKNTEDLTCVHCFADLKKFLFIDECVDKCPPAFNFDNYFACKPCKEFDLWVDELAICKPFSLCDSLSNIDSIQKTCFKCQGEGLMIQVSTTGDKHCISTNCQEGHIVIESNIYFCYEKLAGHFFYKNNYYSKCPNGTSHDFENFICIENCNGSCSEKCCLNGACLEAICVCNQGYVGAGCSIPETNNEETTAKLVSLVNSSIENKTLSNDDLSVIKDINLILKSDNIESASVTLAKNLIDDLISVTDKLSTHGESAQLVFSMLDQISQLSMTIFKLEQDTIYLNKVLETFEKVTDKIMIEMETTREKLKPISFKGELVSFTINPFFEVSEDLDPTNCLDSINKKGISNAEKIPNKVNFYSQDLVGLINHGENSVLLSQSPPIFIQMPPNKADLLTKNCTEKDFDVAKEIKLSDQNNKKLEILTGQGVNQFNQNDDFFVNKCRPFTSDQNTDLTLNERRQQLYIDPKEACTEMHGQICKAKGTTPDGKVKCFCRGIKTERKSTFQDIATSYPKTNYVIVTCLDTFKKSNIIENVGFYVMMVPSFLIVWFSLRFMSRIHSRLQNRNIARSIYEDCRFIEKENMTTAIFFHECNNLKNIVEEIRTIKNKPIDQTELIANTSCVPTYNDYSSLTLEQLALYDSRSFTQFSKDLLIQEHSIFSFMFSKSLLKPKIVAGMLLLTQLNLDIMLNAFFIDDNIVENSNITESLTELFSKEFSKTVWALITTKLIMAALNKISKSNEDDENRFKNSMKYKKEGRLRRAYDRFIVNTSLKRVIFMLICFVFNLFLMYFVVVYTEIFVNSKDIWVRGIFTTVAVNMFIIEPLTPILVIMSRELYRRNKSFIWLLRLTDFLMILRSKLM